MLGNESLREGSQSGRRAQRWPGSTCTDNDQPVHLILRPEVANAIRDSPNAREQDEHTVRQFGDTAWRP